MNYETEWCEEMTAEGPIRVPATRWFAQQDQRMEFVEPAEFRYDTGKAKCVNAQGRAETGSVKMVPRVVDVKRGETILLPCTLDHAVQQEYCEACPDKERSRCRKPEHAGSRRVTGGLGPYMRRLENGAPVPATLHPAIDPSTPQSVAPPTPNDRSLDDRLMQKAQAALAQRSAR